MHATCGTLIPVTGVGDTTDDEATGRWAADDSGYWFTTSDGQYVGLDLGDLSLRASNEVPLGLRSREMHADFLHWMEQCLIADGASDADVRLQGSSVNWFSGRHKEVPWTRPTAFQEMRKRREGRNLPLQRPHEVAQALNLLNSRWPSSALGPRRPFFDLMWRVKIDPAPSDIDVQVSSGVYWTRAVALAEEHGVPVEDLQVENPGYGFLVDDVALEVAPTLQGWAGQWTSRLNRPVVLKIFGPSGPPHLSAGSSMSSHFKADDWKLRVP